MCVTCARMRRLRLQVDVIRLNADLIPLAVYSFLALLTRLWQIGKSNTVVWDEAHFGKFGAVRLQCRSPPLTRQYYINRTVRCYSRNRADLRVLL